MAGERLLNIMRKASAPVESENTDLVFGKVITAEPLTIKISERLIISSDFIYKSSLCPPLVPENRVLILRANKGQLFYVMEVLSDDT